ncbi:hypothetical protein DICPUDRAFT_97963 [Dictyostelium purpureum]|uniref:Mediator of RNA polymerase II transcription subunit 1 n=1 Tax=Dictyostelium purpureum TaxID=5786 RepID=F0ZLF9_DICPU|nr:uncharacterized protein DICPUDRAFT_97963 [Dictyostelium purpureum]EGC35212.1 hypothetical protein DICPUDRAFT_97963 [Dictyostelium purpureum]|eukprot:XP_003288250.1 hypothetical protein DICPUDRAFT_97963 [Dictyostelium purpureum]
MEKQLTLQTLLDNINNSYNTLFESIGSNNINNSNSATNNSNSNSNSNDQDEELFKLNKFHLYGSLNIDEVYNSIDQQLQTIKFTCQQYRSWDQERETSKFLNTQKLYHQAQQRVNLISKTLFDCSLNGKVYLNQQLQQNTNNEQQQQQQQSNNNSNLVEIKRKLGLLIGKLQEMTNELNQKYSTFCVLEDLLSLLKENDSSEFNPESVYSCNISSSTFLLDIFIYGNAEIKEVKLVHISLLSGEDIPAEQEFNDQLTKSLSTDMKDFIERVKRICELDLLFRKYKTFDLQKAFSIFQNDFLTISNLSKEKYLNKELNLIDKDKLLKNGFGEIELDNCGVLIKYFNPYIDQLSKQNQVYSLMIEMESGAAISSAPNDKSEYSKLSLKSQLSQGLTAESFNELLNCFDSNQSEPSETIVSPVRLVCKLSQPLLITVDHLLKILNLTKLSNNDQQQLINLINSYNSSSNGNQDIDIQDNSNNNEYSIQTQLSNTNNLESKHFDIELFSKTQRYYYTGNHNLGLKINRIPITHPIQIFPIIQLLRQQHTFNILLKSCFIQPNNHGTTIKNKYNNQNNDNSDNIPIFEITSNPPNSINIIFLNPTEMNFNSINIIIKNNGDIESQYFDNTSNSTPNLLKSNLFTKLLTKSTSISISLSIFLTYKNN